MKYNELIIVKQSKPRRAGRGISAGRGKTAGRGTKGQSSRAGSGGKTGFEGGQTPLHMRLPKLRGFKSKATRPENVYTNQLDKIKKNLIDNHALHEAGLISSPYVKVKLISKGDMKSKKSVQLQAASRGAIATIEKTGGSFKRVECLAQPSQKLSKDIPRANTG